MGTTEIAGGRRPGAAAPRRLAGAPMSTEDTLPFGMPYKRDTRYDPPPALMALQEQPLRPMRYYPDGTEGWLVTGHAEARRILADPRFVTGERFTHSPTDLPARVRLDLGAGPARVLPVLRPARAHPVAPQGHRRVHRQADEGPRTAHRRHRRRAYRRDARGRPAPPTWSANSPCPCPRWSSARCSASPTPTATTFQRNSADMLDLSLLGRGAQQVDGRAVRLPHGARPGQARRPRRRHAQRSWRPTATSTTSRLPASA